MVVGPKGGKAKSLVTKAGGVPPLSSPILWTSTKRLVLFISQIQAPDTREGIYIWTTCRQFLNGDSTGRLIEYNTKTKKSKILLKGMAFANGVALSKSKRYLLVAETGTARIMRYWLKGNKATKVELFSKLKGMPDNIKRNKRGEFWVATAADSGLLTKMCNF
ncbi:hypothetical protein Scep_021374 [Stephania cephalantha]|uniref:Strictosidine synthase conserved region domain-containing protein n=1 Tax=Stephania cephalantha TaxID=152367 RepID=A0AAP0F3A6_9MAGN